MTNQRAAGQKAIIVMVQERFLAEIDGNLERLGFPDRSSFIRLAMAEKLIAEGVEIPAALRMPPNRTGKGGRPPKKR